MSALAERSTFLWREGLLLSSQAPASIDHAHPVEGCGRCVGGQPKNFLRPCVLLLLSEHESYGYDLMDHLKPFGFARDQGSLYRLLRSLEREELVLSHWETSAAGPDRCRYRLTPLGREWLAAWAETLEGTRHTLEAYLDRYSMLVAAESDGTVTAL